MKTLCSLVLVVLPCTVWADEAAAPMPPPPAEEIKRVLDYQENGKERGPALLDVVPCAKVDTTKTSPTAFTCIAPITGPVKKGTTVNVWTQWFCPKGGKYENITIQAVLDGETRNTTDLTIEGLARTRSWRPFTMNKPGKWQFKVRQGTKELGMTSVTVEP